MGAAPSDIIGGFDPNKILHPDLDPNKFFDPIDPNKFFDHQEDLLDVFIPPQIYKPLGTITGTVLKEAEDIILFDFDDMPDDAKEMIQMFEDGLDAIVENADTIETIVNVVCVVIEIGAVLTGDPAIAEAVEILRRVTDAALEAAKKAKAIKDVAKKVYQVKKALTSKKTVSKKLHHTIKLLVAANDGHDPEINKAIESARTAQKHIKKALKHAHKVHQLGMKIKGKGIKRVKGRKNKAKRKMSKKYGSSIEQMRKKIVKLTKQHVKQQKKRKPLPKGYKTGIVDPFRLRNPEKYKQYQKKHKKPPQKKHKNQPQKKHKTNIINRNSGVVSPYQLKNNSGISFSKKPVKQEKKSMKHGQCKDKQDKHHKRKPTDYNLFVKKWRLQGKTLKEISPMWAAEKAKTKFTKDNFIISQQVKLASLSTPSKPQAPPSDDKKWPSLRL